MQIADQFYDYVIEERGVWIEIIGDNASGRPKLDLDCSVIEEEARRAEELAPTLVVRTHKRTNFNC